MAPFILGSSDLGKMGSNIRCTLFVGELLDVVTLVLGSSNGGFLGSRGGVGADSSVGLGVELLDVISSNLVLDVLRELALEGSSILFPELLHVVSNVSSEDV